MNKLNNRNIFSIKLFWQSFKQLKIIGLISTAIMLFLTAFPIIMEGLSIKNAIKVSQTAANNSLELLGQHSDYTSVIYPVSAANILIIVIAFITPVMALYAWFFLNKRSTSDFYHALSYKRQNLFLSRFTAITAWQLIIMLTSYISAFICYHIFSGYFIVDYLTTFHIYASEFLCALLCSAAIALACSLTGNIFSNICLSGIIIFLPRFILLLVHSSVTNIYAAASTLNFIPLLNNSYNMLTGQFLSVFATIYNTQNMSDILLSGVSNAYTLILAIIYIVLACVLFTTRKSETAGKPALSWKLQFAIRCAMAFTISILGIFIYIQDIRDESNYGYSPVISVIITFIIAAIVVIIYEIISSKKMHRILKAIPSILTAYILAVVAGFLLNAGINNMISYRPDADNIEYIRLAVQNNYNSSETADYFENVINNLKITDKNTIKLITELFNNNATELDTIRRRQNYYTNSSTAYTPYEVYFKDGVLGRYRKVFLKESDLTKLAEALTKLEDFCHEYKNLPSYDEASVTFSDYISSDKSREIYDTMLEEIKNMPFSDWYLLVNSTANYQRGNISYVTIEFTRNGNSYSARFSLSDLMPKSVNAYYNEANKTAAANNTDFFNKIKDSLSAFLNNGAATSKDYGNYFNIDIYSLKNQNNYYIYYNSLKDEALVNAMLKEIDNPFEKNFDSTKPVLEMRYYYENSGRSVSFYMQPSGYNNMSDYPGYEDEAADVPYSRY